MLQVDRIDGRPQWSLPAKDGGVGQLEMLSKQSAAYQARQARYRQWEAQQVDSMWHKCRIGAQGTEGFAEVLTGKEGKGGGWRAVTKEGFQSGLGYIDYAHDMPPYIQDMVEWLDDDRNVHPCNGETALKGFQVMMVAMRSVVQRGKVTLPLGPAEPELEALKRALGG